MEPSFKRLFPGLLAVPLLALGGCSEEPSPPAPGPPKVTVSKPIVKDNEQDFDEFNGYLVARDPVEIRSRVRGFVKEIHFKDPPKDKTDAEAGTPGPAPAAAPTR